MEKGKLIEHIINIIADELFQKIDDKQFCNFEIIDFDQFGITIKSYDKINECDNISTFEYTYYI